MIPGTLQEKCEAPNEMNKVHLTNLMLKEAVMLVNKNIVILLDTYIDLKI